MEPADQVAAAAGFEAPSLAMDQEDLDATVTVNVETVFREIFLVKVLGTLFMALAGVLAFLPALLDYFADPTISDLVGNEAAANLGRVMISMILGIAGIVLGVLGFFMRSIRKWMLYVAPGVLIAAVAARPLTSAIGSLDFMEIILGLAFAVCWFLGVEYLHALSRFVEVGEMAIKRRLTNFNLSGVVKHFLGYGFVMLALVILATLGVVGLVSLMQSASLVFYAIGGVVLALGIVGSLFMVMNENMGQAIIYGGIVAAAGAVIMVLGTFVEGTDLFANSAELNSVYGIAISAAVIFTIFGLVLTLWYTFVEGVSKVEKVEYSREKLKEMLASGQVLDLEEGVVPAGGEQP
jgi:hypothetical protein